MTDENSNINGGDPTDSGYTTPQLRQNTNGVLPLKRVFSRVLADLTNTFQNSQNTPQSEVFNHPLKTSHSIHESSGNIQS